MRDRVSKAMQLQSWRFRRWMRSEVKYQLRFSMVESWWSRGDSENALMRLLALNLRDHPENYVLSDDIDAPLIPDHPSPDYIRRMRNITVIRLAEILPGSAVEITGQTSGPHKSDDQTEPLDPVRTLAATQGNRMGPTGNSSLPPRIRNGGVWRSTLAKRKKTSQDLYLPPHFV